MTMISGTRHEKVALVMTAYVIGFITAYIAFGLNQLISAQLTTTVSMPTYVPSLEKKAPESIISLTMGQDGLSAVTQERALLLSANKSALGASVIESTAGFHASVIGAETAPNGRFVYFCEQTLAEDESCTPYVFSLDDEKTHRLTINAEKVQLPIATHEIFWTEENLLAVSQALSIDPSMPWKLQQETDVVAETVTDAEEIEVPTDTQEAQ